MKVLAVIVHHERPELVLQGLKSLGPELAASGGGCRAIVTAASRHGSDEVIERGTREHGFGGWASLLDTYVYPGAVRELGFPSWRARRQFQGKTDADPPHLLSDFVRFSFLDG